MAEPLTLTAAALWIADKATGGFISDYAKKFVRKRILHVKDETDALREELKESRQTYQSVVDKFGGLLEANEMLSGEVMRLRVENLQLRKELTALKGAR